MTSNKYVGERKMKINTMETRCVSRLQGASLSAAYVCLELENSIGVKN